MSGAPEKDLLQGLSRRFAVGAVIAIDCPLARSLNGKKVRLISHIQCGTANLFRLPPGVVFGEVTEADAGAFGDVAEMVRAFALPGELLGGVGHPAFVFAGHLDEALGGVLFEEFVVPAQVLEETDAGILGLFAALVFEGEVLQVTIERYNGVGETAFTGVTEQVNASENLQLWLPDGVSFDPDEDRGTHVLRTARQPIGSSRTLFMRLNVE